MSAETNITASTPSTDLRQLERGDVVTLAGTVEQVVHAYDPKNSFAVIRLSGGDHLVTAKQDEIVAIAGAGPVDPLIVPAGSSKPITPRGEHTRGTRNELPDHTPGAASAASGIAIQLGGVQSDDGRLAASPGVNGNNIGALRRTLQTMSNDDRSEPGTVARQRFVERCTALLNGIEALEAAAPFSELLASLRRCSLTCRSGDRERRPSFVLAFETLEEADRSYRLLISLALAGAAAEEAEPQKQEHFAR